MKRLSFILLVALALTSCGKASRVKSDAEKAMVQLFKELAKVPESVKVDGVETKYSNDSLCILNANFTAKNGFGNENTTKYEYIYLISNGQAFETINETGEETVFMTPEEYEREKKGKIYEELTYDQAMRHLASIQMITSGRRVGDKDREEVNIPLFLKTGLWEKRQFSNSFNEKTDASYILLSEKGAFSNSATSGSDMTALVFATKRSITIRLVEYSSSLVKDDDSYTMMVKDANNDIHYFKLYNDYDANMTFSSFTGEGEDGFRKILENGGVITCMIEENARYGTPSKYYFKLHVDGYNEAINLL